MKSMYLQYDFILNMLPFHTGRFQYEIHVFSMIILYGICCNSMLGGLSGLSMKSVSSVCFDTEYDKIRYWEVSI